MRVLGIASSVWSMGRGMGMPSLHAVQSEYARQGHDVRLLVPSAADAPPHGEEVTPEGLRILYRRVPLWNARLPGAILGNRALLFAFYKSRWATFAAAMARHALARTRTWPPDVIYGHDPQGAAAAAIVSQLTGVPLVVRLYGTYIHEALASGQRSRVVGLMDDYLSFKLPASLWVITNDGTRGDDVARRLGVPDEKVAFWRNGVDFSTRDPEVDRASVLRELGIAENHKLLVAVARFDAFKGHDRHVKVLADVAKEFPDVTLALVGDGPYRPTVERLVDDLGVRDRVRFTGAVPRAQVKRILNAADVFLALADYSNAGNNLLEAIVAGRPSVALDVGATHEVVVDGVTGYLVAPADWERAAPDRVRLLLQDEQRAVQMGEAAAQFAREKFWTWPERAQAEIRRVEAMVAARKSR